MLATPDTHSHELSTHVISVLSLVDRLDDEFNMIGSALAKACEVDGKLDETQFSQHQIASYEFAFAAAELMAVKNFLIHAQDPSRQIDPALALVFSGDTLPGTFNRFDTITQALEIPSVTNSIRNLDAYCHLQDGVSPRSLDKVGAKISSGGEAFHNIQTNEDVDIARDIFRRLGTDIVKPLAEDIHRNDKTIPESLLTHMRGLGVFGLSVPQQYGGSAPDEGEDNLSMIAITEALSEASLGAAGSLITRPEILTRAILAGGTQAQKELWLPRIATGDPLCAIAITEPDFGSDAANLNLKATKVDGGWKLNGAKTWCTFAGKAGVLMVVARTGPGTGFKGLSILLVEKPSVEGHIFKFDQMGGGVMTGKAIPTIGYRGMHSFDVFFEDYFVPDDNLLGGEAGIGRGFYFTMNGMMGGRIQTAARACGVMIAAITESINYANDRKIFGQKLGEHQLTRSKLAKMTAKFTASRLLAYRVAEMLNDGQGQMEASLAKLFACRSAEHVTRDAVQLHGGMGYAEECAVSRYFVDARVLSIFEGAEEALALRVVTRGILQEHLKQNGAKNVS